MIMSSHAPQPTPSPAVTAGENSDLSYRVFSAARDGRPITLFALLCQRSRTETDRMLRAVTDEADQKTTPFVIAARNGHHSVVRTLLSHYGVDVEQTGIVKFDGFRIDGATALWCAAGAGHMSVVQTLLEFNADVNHATLSGSTPLRAACFDGRLDIVQCLIERNADVHIANKYNNTCLMIAAYKGHAAVIRYLLEKGARPNDAACCGATALHFAAERGCLDIVRLLVTNGACMLPNDQKMTPLDVAADRGHADIVEHLINGTECSRLARIVALELLGASFANDKDNYDVSKCYHYLWLAMHERFCNAGEPLLKAVLPPVAAYDNRVESQTVAELEAIQDDADALHMEALIVRERILGSDNVEIPHPIVFRGAFFADLGLFSRCIALWTRVLNLRQSNHRSASKDLLRFAQLFAQMLFLKVPVSFGAIVSVFHHTLLEFDADHRRICDADETAEDSLNAEDVLNANIHTALYLLAMLIRVASSEAEELSLCKLAYTFNRKRLALRGSGRSPLHMVVDETTYVDDFHIDDVVSFPDDALVRLLLKCGADVNAIDAAGNTPLHLIVQYSRPISHFMVMHDTIVSLLNAGVHVDRANAVGLTAKDVLTSGVAEVILRTKQSMSLKCIAARAVRRHRLPFHGVVPVCLEDFILMH